MGGSKQHILTNVFLNKPRHKYHCRICSCSVAWSVIIADLLLTMYMLTSMTKLWPCPITCLMFTSLCLYSWLVHVSLWLRGVTSEKGWPAVSGSLPDMTPTEIHCFLVLWNNIHLLKKPKIFIWNHISTVEISKLFSVLCHWYMRKQNYWSRKIQSFHTRHNSGVYIWYISTNNHCKLYLLIITSVSGPHT